MKNTDKTTEAFDAVAKVVSKTLGRGATRDQLAEVALLLAHSCLTANQTLPLEQSAHNAKIFCRQLLRLTAETQKDVASQTTVGILM